MLQLPVIEIFGPTFQGEGSQVGQRCCFVRLAGCDFQCDWCDSRFSWMASKFVRMTGEQIVAQLAELDPPVGPKWLVLTGGNPLLHDCTGLLEALPFGVEVAVETQGSIYKDWLGHPNVKHVVVSPKLASSGYEQSYDSVLEFVRLARGNTLFTPFVSVKVVTFTEADVKEAIEKFYPLKRAVNISDFSLSVGTLPDDTAADILARYNLVWQAVLATKVKDIRVLPQMHVLLWGHKRGV